MTSQSRTNTESLINPSGTEPLAVPRGRHVLGLAGAVVIGVLIAIQSRINGALGVRLADGFTAALISFAVGLVLLFAATAVTPSARKGIREIRAALRDGRLRGWQCFGGVCGALLVLSQGLSAAALGVALFTVALVAGQVTSGMVVDRWGLGPGGPQRITARRVIGAMLAVTAVGIAVAASLGSANASVLVVLPLLAGAGTAWQQAVNGRVKQAADSAVAATLLNFAIGTAALAIATIAEIAIRGLPRALPPQPLLYVGGALGVAVIGTAAVLVRRIGVLLLGMGMVAGQLTGALLLDLLAPAPGTQIHISTIAGTGLTLLAVLIAAFPGTRRDSNAPICDDNQS